MGFFDITEDDLQEDEVVFESGEEVVMICNSWRETEKSMNLFCQILSTKHCGKEIPIFISKSDHYMAKKSRIQFLFAFWTRQELLSNPDKTRMIGRVFSCYAGKPWKAESKTIQNFNRFENIGSIQNLPRYKNSADDKRFLVKECAQLGITNIDEIKELADKLIEKPLVMLKCEITKYLQNPLEDL